MSQSFRPLLLCLSLCAPLAGWTTAQQAAEAEAEASAGLHGGLSESGPVAAALMELSEDVQVFNDHIVTLASPWMEGRLPGTRGMELAREYMEFYFKEAGLEPGFEGSWRQPFQLAPTKELLGSELFVNDDALLEGDDYMPMGLGGPGKVSGPAVFVGYGLRPTLASGDYESFNDGDDLTGKIAVLFRLEPMTPEGNSQLAERSFSRRANYVSKLAECADRGAAGIVMINPPEANHEGIHSLIPFSSGNRVKVPVMHVSVDAGERIMEAMDPEGRTLMELRELADAGRTVFDLKGELSLLVEMNMEGLTAENVGGLLPGRGELANELVVIGGHLDHLGLGNFGSRADAKERGRILHPGADDNASGCAAVLMLAERLAADYAKLGDDAEARSILFIGFDAEESGLNGARHYVDEPIRPLDQHALMINFDMIGRITNGKLSVIGAESGKGLQEMLDPIIASTELTIVQPERMGRGGSDHAAFVARGVPVLFSIIADFHDDYHTPRDVSSKINRVDAVRTVHLYHQIGYAAATHPEGFEFQRARPQARRGNNLRFGISIANANDQGPEPGVLVGSVTEGSPAEAAGVKPEDRIVKWAGQELEDVRSWRSLFARQEAGDEVTFEVRRGAEVLALKAVLTRR